MILQICRLQLFDQPNNASWPATVEELVARLRQLFARGVNHWIENLQKLPCELRRSAAKT
ncbi:hypothetical protein [Pseudomonas viridiflava]|uniref:hypothetical protein n=1 Tax=Pseudomonas viridiflava TaxID=33069 RepID=UPI000F03267E|nr:hypothetical protein [Pseudomonas viridiflava]